MTTKVEKSIIVNVPVSTVYNQWTQFEEFPHFMGGVKSVTQLSDSRLQWVAEIAGVRRQWEAQILEQIPDTKVAWAATEGATNAGAVTFDDVGGGQTNVHLSLEYEPEGLVEKAGDALNIVEKQAESDLERFKAFIEDEGYASGAWRGTVDTGLPVGTPTAEDAVLSEGDKGKAGISGKLAAAAGVGLAAAATAAVAASKSGSSDTPEQPVGADLAAEPQPVTPPVQSTEPAQATESVEAAGISDAPAVEDPTAGLDAPAAPTPGSMDALADDRGEDDSDRRL